VTDKIIAIFSGGLDSTTAVHDAISQGLEPDLVSFNYGQRHKKELAYAQLTANKLGLRHDIVDLSGLTTLLAESGSSLVSDTEVPEGHYAEDNMKATVVPNRNMIMLSIAGGIAVARGAIAVMTGVHAGDHFIYPDCRPEFLQAAGHALVVGNEGFNDWMHHPNADVEFVAPILAPYLMSTKEDIAYRAFELDVPIHETWSCYKGGELHCGKCGTCVERLEALDGAMRRGILVDDKWYVDLTQYEDTEYWKLATDRVDEED
jgi:7-cyano-7-deazaguanine synthase